jgi:hypothetical protein
MADFALCLWQLEKSGTVAVFLVNPKPLLLPLEIGKRNTVNQKEGRMKKNRFLSFRELSRATLFSLQLKKLVGKC